MKPDQVKSSSNPLVSGTRRVSPRKRSNEDVHSGKESGKSSESKTLTSKKARSVNVKKEKIVVTRPSPQECYFVTDALSQLHPHIVEENNQRRKALLASKQQLRGTQKNSKHAMHTPVTDQVIGTMLSQNTTDANCHKAFANLKKDFPNGWDEVANVQDITRIENSIKVAGLAKTRARRIQGMLQSIQAERGDASFEYLQSYESNDEIAKDLSRFKGMGPKTISCVLLFALGRNDFPVDTHVLRITQQMGWVGKAATRESAYEHFKNTVPGDCMMDLHCLIVQHGKICYNCAANGKPQFPPACGKAKWICPLTGIKSGKDDLSDYVSSRFNGMVDIKIESGAGKVVVKQETGASVDCAAGLDNPEETPSCDKVQSETQESSSKFNDQIKPEVVVSGVAIKVERF